MTHLEQYLHASENISWIIKRPPAVSRRQPQILLVSSYQSPEIILSN